MWFMTFSTTYLAQVSGEPMLVSCGVVLFFLFFLFVVVFFLFLLLGNLGRGFLRFLVGDLSLRGRGRALVVANCGYVRIVS